jgi:hypothetical protein
MVLRVEDLAVSSPHEEALTLARLIKFVGVTEANHKQWLQPVALVASAAAADTASADDNHDAAAAAATTTTTTRICAAFRHHGLGSFPFNGNKYSKTVRQSRVAMLGEVGGVALRHFGYDPDAWGVKKSKHSKHKNSNNKHGAGYGVNDRTVRSRRRSSSQCSVFRSQYRGPFL